MSLAPGLWMNDTNLEGTDVCHTPSSLLILFSPVDSLVLVVMVQ